MSVDLNSTKYYVRELFNYLGFKNFELYLDHSSVNYGFNVGLSKKLDYTSLTTMTNMSDWIKKELTEIENSDFMKDKRRDLTDKLEKAEQENLKLQKEIEQLQVYKHHYDLELQLRHNHK